MTRMSPQYFHATGIVTTLIKRYGYLIRSVWYLRSYEPFGMTALALLANCTAKHIYLFYVLDLISTNVCITAENSLTHLLLQIMVKAD